MLESRGGGAVGRGGGGGAGGDINLPRELNFLRIFFKPAGRFAFFLGPNRFFYCPQQATRQGKAKKRKESSCGRFGGNWVVSVEKQNGEFGLKSRSKVSCLVRSFW